MSLKWLLIVLVNLTVVFCQLNTKAFDRNTDCREPAINDDNGMSVYVDQIIPKNPNKDKLTGFMGTVGIIGGCLENTGPPYFAAIAALKTGADSVYIFSTPVAANPIKAYNPEIHVLPVFNSGNKMFEMITLMDVIVLGPGLEKHDYVFNILLIVIDQCKKERKPLVVDLDEFFLTTAIVTRLYNYPLPGVIFMANTKEFEKLYYILKTPTLSSDATIDIDFKKAGDNIFVFRKGCTDMGVSKEKKYTWTLSEGGSSKRSTGQGDMLAGSTATYFFWATRQLHSNNTVNYGSMLPPAVATYSAAKLIRASNRKAFQEKSRSMATSDMIGTIQSAIFDMY